MHANHNQSELIKLARNIGIDTSQFEKFNKTLSTLKDNLTNQNSSQLYPEEKRGG